MQKIFLAQHQGAGRAVRGSGGIPEQAGIKSVGHPEVARGVHRHSLRASQRNVGGRSGAAVGEVRRIIGLPQLHAGGGAVGAGAYVLEHAVVAVIGNPDVVAAGGHAGGHIKGVGRRGPAAVGLAHVESGLAQHQGGLGPVGAGSVVLDHAVVAEIGGPDGPRSGHGYRDRVIQPALRKGSGVGGKIGLAQHQYRGLATNGRRIIFQYTVIAGIRHPDAAGSARGHGHRGIQRGRGSGKTILRKIRLPEHQVGGRAVCGRDGVAQHAVIAGIGHPDLAAGAHRDPVGRGQPAGGGGAAAVGRCAGKIGLADNAVGRRGVQQGTAVPPQYAVIIGIHHVEPARDRVYGCAAGKVQAAGRHGVGRGNVHCGLAELYRGRRAVKERPERATGKNQGRYSLHTRPNAEPRRYMLHLSPPYLPPRGDRAPADMRGRRAQSARTACRVL